MPGLVTCELTASGRLDGGDYCLMIVPSRLPDLAPAAVQLLRSPLRGPNGYFAAAFSSISIPQPGVSLTYR